MSQDYVEKLIQLGRTPHPVEQPASDDWLRIEDDLRLTFPADFKRLVSAFGTGHFGIGLHLRNPCASSEYIRLSHDALISYAQMSSRAANDSGIDLYPQPIGSVEIGGIDRHDFLLQPDVTGKQLSQLLWWSIDEEKVHKLATSISQFIHDLYLGKIGEEWADELRNYFWRGGDVPLFTAWTPGSKAGEIPLN